MSLSSTFAANVKRFRLARGMTQGELGKALGVTYTTVLNYEKAAKWPGDEMMEELAKALGVRPWQLLAGESEGGEIPPEVPELVAQLARACGLKVSRPS